CTFCSNEAQMLLNHPIHKIGSLCVECYMHFHGSCGVCNGSFLPAEIKEDVNYRIKAKFISMGENKSFVVCDCCYKKIREEFPEQFIGQG
ncbi:hypothetical protein AB4Z22_18555, partial [Paenibacillus sp. TAF58]